MLHTTILESQNVVYTTMSTLCKSWNKVATNIQVFTVCEISKSLSLQNRFLNVDLSITCKIMGNQNKQFHSVQK